MSRTKKDSTLFLIHYRDPKDGQILSLKARKVYDSPLGLSFVCISDFVFENESLVVKPAEEHLRKRLENVKSLHLSIYTILSIEELGEKENSLKFKKDKAGLVVLPQETHPLRYIKEYKIEKEKN